MNADGFILWAIGALFLWALGLDDNIPPALRRKTNVGIVVAAMLWPLLALVFILSRLNRGPRP